MRIDVQMMILWKHKKNVHNNGITQKKQHQHSMTVEIFSHPINLFAEQYERGCEWRERDRENGVRKKAKLICLFAFHLRNQNYLWLN